MSANSYVTRIADAGILRDSERESVERSLAVLRTRLASHFTDTVLTGKPLKRHLVFGSYTRGTILPRNMDAHSDVDYMVVFSDSEAKPQAYLDRLRRFVEGNYPRSEIAQSNPTIVLSLNHIRFELVPAIETTFGGLQIPAPVSLSYTDWMATTPNDSNEALTQKNKDNNNLIKPLVRLVKYWNACNNYPYESFALEKMVVSHFPISVILFGGTLWDRFASFVSDLSPAWGDPAYKKQAVSRAQEIVNEAKTLETQNRPDEVERKLQRLLPLVTASS